MEMLSNAEKLLCTKYWGWVAGYRSDWRTETGKVMARKRTKWEEGDAEDNRMTQEERRYKKME